jgi:hypothetical protein
LALRLIGYLASSEADIQHRFASLLEDHRGGLDEYAFTAAK